MILIFHEKGLTENKKNSFSAIQKNRSAELAAFSILNLGHALTLTVLTALSLVINSNLAGPDTIFLAFQ